MRACPTAACGATVAAVTVESDGTRGAAKQSRASADACVAARATGSTATTGLPRRAIARSVVGQRVEARAATAACATHAAGPAASSGADEESAGAAASARASGGACGAGLPCRAGHARGTRGADTSRATVAYEQATAATVAACQSGACDRVAASAAVSEPPRVATGTTVGATTA
jgi:hypothetical protein